MSAFAARTSSPGSETGSSAPPDVPLRKACGGWIEDSESEIMSNEFNGKASGEDLAEPNLLRTANMWEKFDKLVHSILGQQVVGSVGTPTYSPVEARDAEEVPFGNILYRPIPLAMDDSHVRKGYEGRRNPTYPEAEGTAEIEPEDRESQAGPWNDFEEINSAAGAGSSWNRPILISEED